MAETGEEKSNSVVIIEDEDPLREMYKIKFTAEKFTVFEAPNGKVGLEVVKANKPDVILLDIFMPEMNGFDVLQALKKDPDPAINKIPVLLLTNLAEDAGHEKGISMGAAGYVMKVSRTPEQVVQLTRAVLQSNKPENPA